MSVDFLHKDNRYFPARESPAYAERGVFTEPRNVKEEFTLMALHC
jgi:hypothetical protein